ncbi:MAG: hypothetical protein DMG32_06405 [Acidobacteria bacterium]|nr:MAG: hypothetical protein DMG32_06405 [Acidobacteriota bacterium]
MQNNSFIVTINEVPVTAAALEIIHYFSMFLVVGPTAMVDLRVLGAADRHHPVAELAERFFPWVWVALAFNALSGFLMFAGNAVAYIPESTFHAKMLVTLLAVVFTLAVQWSVPKWDRLPVIPATAKVVALLSLVLWIGAILAGVEVPALSGIG